MHESMRLLKSYRLRTVAVSLSRGEYDMAVTQLGFGDGDPRIAELMAGMDLPSEDWGDSESTLLGILWNLCEVLRAYEGPDWGNTGGRYGHSGGHLGKAEWTAIETGDEDYEFPDHEAMHVIGAGQWAASHDYRDVVRLADIVSAAVDLARDGAR